MCFREEFGSLGLQAKFTRFSGKGRIARMDAGLPACKLSLQIMISDYRGDLRERGNKSESIPGSAQAKTLFLWLESPKTQQIR